GLGRPLQAMSAFIDEHRDAHGVEPICKVLPIAPSTYRAHAATRRDPEKGSARARLLDKKFAAFRGLPELLTPRLGEHQFQPLDFERPNLCLASKRKDHRMGGGKVFRKRIG